MLLRAEIASMLCLRRASSSCWASSCHHFSLLLGPFSRSMYVIPLHGSADCPSNQKALSNPPSPWSTTRVYISGSPMALSSLNSNRVYYSLRPAVCFCPLGLARRELVPQWLERTLKLPAAFRPLNVS